MRTLNHPSGDIFIPESIIERRGMVTGLNLFDEENGILRSQRAKYEKQHWALVSGMLVGRDKAPEGALTCVKISERLEPYGIFIKPHAIKRIIQQMKHPRVAVRKDNRRLGQSGLEIILQMGGIKEIDVPAVTSTGVAYVTKAYYFGELHSEVVRLRRAFEPIVSRRP